MLIVRGLVDFMVSAIRASWIWDGGSVLDGREFTVFTV